MKKILTLVLLMSVLIFSSASAGIKYTDGHKIFSACNELRELLSYHFELDSFEAGRCWGYLSASIDIYQITSYGSTRIVCIPEDKEPSDLVKIIIDYLKEHPNELDHQAFELITKALAEFFPCPQTQLEPQPPK